MNPAGMELDRRLSLWCFALQALAVIAGGPADVSSLSPRAPAAARPAVIPRAVPPVPRPAEIVAQHTGAPPSLLTAGAPDAKRLRIRDEAGQVVIARIHGGEGSRVALLPDGRLGWPRSLVFTDEPFRPLTTTELRERLAGGELNGFQVVEKAPYLVFYNGSKPFAESSAKLLASLYEGLSAKLREKGLPVGESEFPLVAVIYRTEEGFRAAHRRAIDEDVQAFYDVVLNRIYLFETARRDHEAPDFAARRKPQTVAHEGTHQILQNIGVQPRLAHWPPWLVEGLAEYFAPTATGRRGDWAGPGAVNPFHMATIRDLHDPLTGRFGTPAAGGDRARNADSLKSLLTREQLDATDYARSWALTHYLATKRLPELLAYLKELGALRPEAPVTADEQLSRFRKRFGDDVPRMERSIVKYLGALKGYEPIPYYAVTFEQPVGAGAIHRAAFVSQSPAMINRWIVETATPRGGAYLWHAYPFPTRARAVLAAQEWFQGGP